MAEYLIYPMLVGLGLIVIPFAFKSIHKRVVANIINRVEDDLNELKKRVDVLEDKIQDTISKREFSSVLENLKESIEKMEQHIDKRFDDLKHYLKI